MSVTASPVVRAGMAVPGNRLRKLLEQSLTLPASPQALAVARAAGAQAVADTMDFLTAALPAEGGDIMALPEGADEGAWAVAAGRAAAALAPETFDTELTAARAGTFTHTVLARAPGLKADLAPYLAFHTDGSVAARPSGVWRGASRGTKRARSDAPAVVGDVDVSQGAAAAAQSAVLAHGAVAARPTAAPAVITKAHRKAARGAAPDTAGKGWFNLAAPEMTAQVKADLEVLKNRRALDPRRFYKGKEEAKSRKYFAIGTVQEGWAEGVPGRMTRKERQGSLLGEVAADARLAAYAKRKYGEHQDAAAKRGKGAAFKRTQARRSSWRRK